MSHLDTINNFYDPRKMGHVVFARKHPLVNGKYIITNDRIKRLKKSFSKIFLDPSIMPDPSRFARVILLEDKEDFFSIYKQSKRKRIRLIKMEELR